jgi:hypothetical protein
LQLLALLDHNFVVIDALRSTLWRMFLEQ